MLNEENAKHLSHLLVQKDLFNIQEWLASMGKALFSDCPWYFLIGKWGDACSFSWICLWNMSFTCKQVSITQFCRLFLWSSFVGLFQWICIWLLLNLAVFCLPRVNYLSPLFSQYLFCMGIIFIKLSGRIFGAVEGTGMLSLWDSVWAICSPC